MLQLFMKACLSDISPCTVPPAQVTGTLSNSLEPSQEYSTLLTPVLFSSAEASVTILNTEPGAYWPCRQRFK